MNQKISALILTLLLFVGCSGKANSDDAVRKAILDHLSSRPGLDMSKMDVDISKVTSNGDKASVDVIFKAKGGAANQTMGMTYDLVRSGDAWKVQGMPTGHGTEGGGAGASPHGAGGPPMAQVPGDGSEKAGSSESFHPQVGGSSALPPGHPPMNPPATSKQ
jgi:hypothetical protein